MIIKHNTEIIYVSEVSLTSTDTGTLELFIIEVALFKLQKLFHLPFNFYM